MWRGHSQSKARQPYRLHFPARRGRKAGLDPRQEKKELARVFQALRIETNDETGDLRRFLEASARVLKLGEGSQC